MKDITEECKYKLIIEGDDPKLKVKIYHKNKRIASLNYCAGLSTIKGYEIKMDSLGNLKIMEEVNERHIKTIYESGNLL